MNAGGAHTNKLSVKYSCKQYIKQSISLSQISFVGVVLIIFWNQRWWRRRRRRSRRRRRRTCCKDFLQFRSWGAGRGAKYRVIGGFVEGNNLYSSCSLFFLIRWRRRRGGGVNVIVWSYPPHTVVVGPCNTAETSSCSTCTCGVNSVVGQPIIQTLPIVARQNWLDDALGANESNDVNKVADDN